MEEKKITEVDREKLCSFCGKVIESLENYCSTKCQELDEISEAIQKINFCVEILKEKIDLKSEKQFEDVLRILDKNSMFITKNIRLLQNNFLL